jgi:A/G-specific adenine glycosylase
MAPSIEDCEIEWFREDVVEWYKEHGRNFPWRAPDTNLYRHVLAEILLQRTRAETLAPFFDEFAGKYDSWASLATVSVQDLEQELKPIGLASQRAPRINALAKIIVQKEGQFPENLDDLLSLPAVGQYVAYAIQSYRGIWRFPLLDAGMARVIERCFGPRELADIRYDAKLQEICQRVVDTEQPLKISWAILDLAALVCRPKNPLCDKCPVERLCRFSVEVSTVP